MLHIRAMVIRYLSGRRHAAARCLKKIPVVVYNVDAASSKCTICLQEIVAGDKVWVLPWCSHAYHHQACINRWLLMPSTTCPNCRCHVIGDDHDADESHCATATSRRRVAQPAHHLHAYLLPRY